jgi:hypothetical protein
VDSSYPKELAMKLYESKRKIMATSEELDLKNIMDCTQMSGDQNSGRCNGQWTMES